MATATDWSAENALSASLQKSKDDILFIGFNQDGTSLCVGLKNGYRIYQIHSADNIELVFECKSEKDVCLVDRLFSSSLVAIVSLNSPRMVRVCHYKKGHDIVNYSYSNTILAVRMNRMRLVVCLEETLYIHNIRNMEVLHTIRDTPSNPDGLICLSSSEETSYLAYPGSSILGEVQIFDANHLKAVTMIPAHSGALACMAFDQNGLKLATASVKGTVIRVFSIPSGEKLYELRRGMKRNATIYSLGFSYDGSMLSSSSNTETLHIFKLETPGKERQVEEKQNSSWMGYLNKAISSSASYLPTQVADVMSQGRSFATVRHPFVGVKNVSVISILQKMPRLLVASADGFLYVYGIDPIEGGECNLLRQHKLDNLVATPIEPAGDAQPASAANANDSTDAKNEADEAEVEKEEEKEEVSESHSTESVEKEEEN